MTDREKVIKGLECCIEISVMCWDNPKCPYNGYNDCMSIMTRDALALLKAQEPRVMTLKEAKSASGYVIVQSRTCNILELQLIKDGFVYDSIAVPIAVDDLWWEGYNKYWRLWTSVPTDAQREATPWNAQN